MNKKKNIMIISLFIISIYAVFLLNLLKPDLEKSEFENRVLEQRPKVAEIMSGDFSQKMDNYCSDQFFIRDILLKLNIKWKVATKKSVLDGSYYVVDNGWLFGKPEQTYITDEEIDLYSNNFKLISEVAKEYNKDLYYFSTPCKVGTLDFMYPKYVDKSRLNENEIKFLREIEKQGIKTINCNEYFEEKFSKTELKSMYLKTDHHWNRIGAFEAMDYFVKKFSEIEKVDADLNKEDYETIWIRENKFLGSYNKSLFNLFPMESDVPILTLKNNDVKYYEFKEGNIIPIEKSKIISPRKTKGIVEYSDIYTDDKPYYKVINEFSQTNKRVLVIKDSYQCPTTEMFSDIFRETEVIDPRHLKMSVEEVFEHSDADVVVFMFNSAAKIDEMLLNLI